MALFVKDSKGYHKQSWHNHYAGQSIILCGTGPSLHDMDADKLKGSQLPLFGLNNAFEVVDLDFWMAFDEPGQFDKKLWSRDCIKFYPWDYRNKYIVRKASNVFFYKAYGLSRENHEGGEEFREDLELGGPYINFIFEGYTFSMALHMIYWLGFSKVFLAGCDFGGESQLSELSSNYNEADQQCVLQKGLECLEEIKSRGALELVSCTADSPINEFLPYQPL